MKYFLIYYKFLIDFYLLARNVIFTWIFLLIGFLIEFIARQVRNRRGRRVQNGWRLSAFGAVAAVRVAARLLVGPKRTPRLPD